MQIPSLNFAIKVKIKSEFDLYEYCWMEIAGVARGNYKKNNFTLVLKRTKIYCNENIKISSPVFDDVDVLD
jgi:hypothetical protein